MNAGLNQIHNLDYIFLIVFFFSILFIIFDVEISLMLPVPFLMGSDVGLWIFILFMVMFICGLIYDYVCGSLDWLETS